MQRTEEYKEANDKVTEMNTLSMVLNKVVKNGYQESFTVTNRGMQPQSNAEKNYPPEEVHVINFYRFEGDTDPGDMSILYVIETSDGAKGTLIDAYGTYSDPKVNTFMQEVEDIQKKVVKDDNQQPGSEDKMNQEQASSPLL